MALKSPPTPLIITATQGSNDAFAQGSVLTGLAQRQAYNLKGLLWQLTSPILAANGGRYQIALTRRSKTSMPNASDPDVVWMRDFIARFVTSGLGWADQAGYFTFPLDMPLVEETLYACIDTDSTSAAATFVLRLDVEIDTISDLDRLNLITRSLS